MKYIVTIAFFLYASNTFSQVKIELTDVSKHIGDSVRISAVIYGGKYLEQAKGAPTFLNVGGDYPKAPLTLVIWNEVRKQFHKQMPEVILKGKECVIFGKIELYRGKPQIVIYNAKQIVEPVKVDIN